MPSGRDEKRSEPRIAHEGAVQILCDDGLAPYAICARLVDFSPKGFRVAHENTTLTKGQIVRFHHHKAAGTARVVWNRINGGVTETGFLVL